MILNISLAWLQLARQKARFFVASTGIAFIAVMMFIQVGFQDALYTSATQLHNNLKGDLFIISNQYQSLTFNQSFPRWYLYQILGCDGIESVNPLYMQFAKLKNLTNGIKFPIYVLGFDPNQQILTLPDIQKNHKLLQLPNIVLFDSKSRSQFGPIPQDFELGKPVTLEIFNYTSPIGYKVKVGGLFSLGPSFGVDGNLIVSASTFFQIFEGRSAQNVDIGSINLKPDANPQKVLAILSAKLPKDVIVITRQDFINLEKNYWTLRAPIGFVFQLMVTMVFVVGVVVVYQILYSNIASHLVEYATLKAMGFKNQYLLIVVFQQALILASFGYIPGFAISIGLYDVAKSVTNLPITMSLDKAAMVLFFIILMCLASGFISTKKLRKIDPADFFSHL
ncbi:ABC transporter [Nostoc linckia z18]|jgi:putative ABC transport system permease protein|uniref:ABC transporter n=2 Tax=Nostoc linckia TaxID=92942 RepID=A0A9Q6EKN9_NOSLI|nr:ABC transporter permease DevC [Nostoc linckia]MBL1200238.1 FtsX-like permease family protein [Nostoc sp. GBBB01]MDZ8012040.1 ABC transporter permease DevC [Nostoc sp. ZfuVER08]PHK39790.1 ABC transporter [Nostoc linckia z16]PHK41641.1 ABC transporter [Nostoc linckia z15]PHJ63051.1 ABC transporter [Nostoc linckia z1]